MTVVVSFLWSFVVLKRGISTAKRRHLRVHSIFEGAHDTATIGESGKHRHTTDYVANRKFIHVSIYQLKHKGEIKKHFKSRPPKAESTKYSNSLDAKMSQYRAKQIHTHTYIYIYIHVYPICAPFLHLRWSLVHTAHFAVLPSNGTYGQSLLPSQ